MLTTKGFTTISVLKVIVDILEELKLKEVLILNESISPQWNIRHGRTEIDNGLIPAFRERTA